jgi:hypothetical protein
MACSKLDYATEVRLLEAHVVLNAGLSEELLTILQCIRLLWFMSGTSSDTLVMLSDSFKEIPQIIVQRL